MPLIVQLKVKHYLGGGGLNLKRQFENREILTWILGLTLSDEFSYCQDWRETYKRLFPMKLKTTFKLKYIGSLLVRGPDWVLYTWSHSSSEPAWTWKLYNWSTSTLHCTSTYTVLQCKNDQHMYTVHLCTNKVHMYTVLLEKL